MSKRHACEVVGQHRSIQRCEALVVDDEWRLFADMRELTAKHPRQGYLRIHQMLLWRGWRVKHMRVKRLWRHEGMGVRCKHRQRARNGDSSNSYIRTNTVAKNHVWSYDFPI